MWSEWRSLRWRACLAGHRLCAVHLCIPGRRLLSVGMPQPLWHQQDPWETAGRAVGCRALVVLLPVLPLYEGAQISSGEGSKQTSCQTRGTGIRHLCLMRIRDTVCECCQTGQSRERILEWSAAPAAERRLAARGHALASLDASGLYRRYERIEVEGCNQNLGSCISKYDSKFSKRCYKVCKQSVNNTVQSISKVLVVNFIESHSIASCTHHVLILISIR